MSKIKIWDLKSGSGELTKLGDTLELRFQVASSLANLDSGVLLQTNWAPGDSAVHATLGAGQLRRAIEVGLTEVRVGTNRRFRVPAGVWPDVDSLLVIGIDVGAIVPSPRKTASDWTFDEMASAIPLAELERVQKLDREVYDLLEEAALSIPKGGQSPIIRLLVPHAVYPHLQALLDERGLGAKLRYGVNEIGTVPGGDYEVEIAVEDIDRLLRLLERGK